MKALARMTLFACAPVHFEIAAGQRVEMSTGERVELRGTAAELAEARERISELIDRRVLEIVDQRFRYSSK